MATLTLTPPTAPDGLLAALAKHPLRYTSPVTVYHMVWSSGYRILVGVFGDGANGAYEWFIWDDIAKSLKTSDVGFGCDCTALCCGLIEAGTGRGHDLFLTWERR